MIQRIVPILFLSLLLGGVACKTAERQTESVVDKDLETANQYSQDRLYREAIATYLKVLKKDPGNLLAHRNLGMVYVQAGNYKKASYHLEHSLSAYEDDYEANFYLGESYRAREKYSDAIFRYKKALQTKPDDPRTLKALTWSYYKIRLYAEALRLTRQMQKTSAGDQEITIMTARILLKLNRPERALALMQNANAVAKKSDLPYLKSVEGDILQEMKQCNKAVEVYHYALKEQPLLAGALFGLGQCMLTMNQDREKALTYIERAVRIKPRFPEALYSLAKSYEKTDKKKSLRYYRLFAKQASVDPEYLVEMKMVHDKIKSLANAK
jgi:tetratricopeptide (TPR) repeat protein